MIKYNIRGSRVTLATSKNTVTLASGCFMLYLISMYSLGIASLILFIINRTSTYKTSLTRSVAPQHETQVNNQPNTDITQTYTHTYTKHTLTHTHTHTHARAHTHAHTHTHTKRNETI